MWGNKFSRGLLMGLATLAISNPAFAQQSVVPYIANGTTASGKFTYCVVGSGNADACSMPVTASVTVGGFAPNGNSITQHTVTSPTDNVALPAGTAVLVQNSGTTNGMYFKLGTSNAVTATANDIYLGPGSSCVAVVGSNTWIAFLQAAGTTTSNVTGGAGLGSCPTGGGGSSGSSNAVAQGSTTAGQNVTPQGCRTLTSAPTDTTAQTNMPWCRTNGTQAVDNASVNGVTTLAGAGAVGTGSPRVAVGQDTTTIAGSAPGTAASPSTNVITTIPVPSASSAIGIAPTASTAAESCHVLKASAGTLYTLGGYGGQSEFVMVFNATSAPADGAVTPVIWGYLGAGGVWGISFNYPEYLSTGITVCYSSTGPFTKTAISTNNSFSAQVQ